MTNIYIFPFHTNNETYDSVLAQSEAWHQWNALNKQGKT